jgi:hypothetical protein
MSGWSGGCACRAIRYQCDSAPLLMLNCHCRDCQQASGSGYAAVAVMRADVVHVTGTPRYYSRVGDSGGTIERGFCEQCGSPLFGRIEKRPQLLLLRAASLDDPSMFKPAADVFTDSAHAWDAMDPAVAKYPRSMQR